MHMKNVMNVMLMNLLRTIIAKKFAMQNVLMKEFVNLENHK